MSVTTATAEKFSLPSLLQSSTARVVLMAGGAAVIVALMAGIWFWGQQPAYRRFGLRDGLPQSQVTALLEDRCGACRDGQRIGRCARLPACAPSTVLLGACAYLIVKKSSTMPASNVPASVVISLTAGPVNVAQNSGWLVIGVPSASARSSAASSPSTARMSVRAGWSL